MATLQKFHILNNKGQSIVEYLLVLLVVSTVAFSIFRHPDFKNFIGPNSNYFNALRRGMEYGYRFGSDLPDGNYNDLGFSYGNNEHSLYVNKQEGASRFFANREEYGANN